MFISANFGFLHYHFSARIGAYRYIAGALGSGKLVVEQVLGALEGIYFLATSSKIVNL